MTIGTERAVVGTRMPRADARPKSTGTAVYATDIVLPGMLHGKILRSTVPHARIRALDTSAAERLRGVKAIISGKDTLGRRFGMLRFKDRFMDERPLLIDKARYIGDEIAAVAAVDEDTACEALELIRVEYEELPAVFDPEEALRPGAPLVHDDVPGNISRRIAFNFGEVDQLLAESFVVRTDTFRTQGTSAAPLEPHATVAQFDATGRLTVWTSTQVPYIVKSDLALTLGIPDSSVRVILPYVGGAFGNKSDGMFPLDYCAALLSRKTGRPVRIVYDREEEFIVGRRRHPATVTLTTGVSRDGVILARDARVILDGGGYNAYGPATILLCGIFLNLPYRYQAYRYEGIRAYTNNPTASAIRGHGAPQVHFASDAQLDMLAEEIGMDPLEIRLRNALRTGETTLNGFTIASSGFPEVLQAIAERSGWKEKYGKLPPGKGIGIGASGFPSGTGFRQRPEIPTYSSATVRVNEDGSIGLFTGATDTGQGSDNVVVAITAEVLGSTLDNIHLTRADTDITPVDLGNYSSRTTVYAGNAVRQAAEEVRVQLWEVAADLLEAHPDDIEARNGEIYVRGAPGRALRFEAVAKEAIERRKGKPLVGEGSFDPPDKINYATYSFGAQIAEVTVDAETGQVTVDRITSAHDCGVPINPMSVEGQVEGSIHLALGLALSEDLVLEEGLYLNSTFLEYKIATSLEMPEVDNVHVEVPDPVGPFGAKEAGEGTVGPTAPAIANAVYNAIGVRMNELPITPARVVRAVDRVKRKGE